MHKIIITGASGSGKTTIIEELKKEGYAIIPEAARRVVEEKRIETGNERQKLIFQKQIELERDNCASRITFLDRSIIDCIVYSIFYCGESPHHNKAIKNANYHNRVFLLKLPLFTKYPDREESYEESLQIQELLKTKYEKMGFQVIKIPFTTARKRIKMILRGLR
jgi:predicted ATPase